MKYSSPPESEEWRGKVIHELLEGRKNCMNISGFEHIEISEILKYLCIIKLKQIVSFLY